ncbi:hypothetical protein A4A59_015485 [Rhizobium leguminosarum]|uniref:Uncharacterized protein n=2 Tax=Rhizobium leguminosarum TaxID=384 RepID=A0A154I7I6_RHILE|nr:hypothetical protein [Rhizobium leguminosarum]KZA96506.1 hypothetical protein A4A59_05275 [Rhizobium leguminosarum]
MLDVLRKQVGQKSLGISALKEFEKNHKKVAKAKSKLSAVAVNKTLKLAAKAGMTVTDIKVHPDGSVNLAVVEKNSISPTSAAANPWDEVLK